MIVQDRWEGSLARGATEISIKGIGLGSVDDLIGLSNNHLAPSSGTIDGCKDYQ
jgi:hypothetical protein